MQDTQQLHKLKHMIADWTQHLAIHIQERFSRAERDKKKKKVTPIHPQPAHTNPYAHTTTHTQW